MTLRQGREVIQGGRDGACASATPVTRREDEPVKFSELRTLEFHRAALPIGGDIHAVQEKRAKVGASVGGFGRRNDAVMVAIERKRPERLRAGKHELRLYAPFRRDDEVGR